MGEQSDNLWPPAGDFNDEPQTEQDEQQIESGTYIFTADGMTRISEPEITETDRKIFYGAIGAAVVTLAAGVAAGRKIGRR